MDLVVYILLGLFAIFVAFMSLKQGKQNRGKSLEQRREETYQRYEQRIGEFRETKNEESEPSGKE